jgi:hypothetical protein
VAQLLGVGRPSAVVKVRVVQGAVEFGLALCPARKTDQRTKQEDNESDSDDASRAKFRPPVTNEFGISPEREHYITSCFDSFM